MQLGDDLAVNGIFTFMVYVALVKEFKSLSSVDSDLRRGTIGYTTELAIDNLIDHGRDYKMLRLVVLVRDCARNLTIILVHILDALRERFAELKKRFQS